MFIISQTLKNYFLKLYKDGKVRIPLVIIVPKSPNPCFVRYCLTSNPDEINCFEEYEYPLACKKGKE